MSPFLTLVLTTPPTPNAGTMRAILANELFNQSLLTLAHLSLAPSVPSLLYRSRPSRCKGVEINCTAAGARNCVEGVRRDISAAIQHEDQSKRLGEEKVVWSDIFNNGLVDCKGCTFCRRCWVHHLSLETRLGCAGTGSRTHCFLEVGVLFCPLGHSGRARKKNVALISCLTSPATGTISAELRLRPRSLQRARHTVHLRFSSWSAVVVCNRTRYLQPPIADRMCWICNDERFFRNRSLCCWLLHKSRQRSEKAVCSDVSNSELALIHLALAVAPRVGITTRLADDTETSGLHAATCAIGANIAVAGVALEHSLKGVGGLGLDGVDLVNVALEGLAILQGDHRVGARVLVNGFGVGHDRAARSSAQLAMWEEGPMLHFTYQSMHNRAGSTYRRKGAHWDLAQLQWIDVSGVMLRFPGFGIRKGIFRFIFFGIGSSRLGVTFGIRSGRLGLIDSCEPASDLGSDVERRDLAPNESLERTLPDLLSARGLTGVSLSSDQYISLNDLDDACFLGVFGLVRGSEVVDHSDPLLGETSLLDGQEPDDELGGPMLNMMAVPLSVVVASREHRSITQGPVGTAGIRLTTVFSLTRRSSPSRSGLLSVPLEGDGAQCFDQVWEEPVQISALLAFLSCQPGQ
ncbi:hypothetical protein KCU87_g346, partial [Aureobasidium melanogenum]